MLGKTLSITLTGVEGELVEVQTNITRGLPKFNIVGLPDTAIEEARLRVKSAIIEAGVPFPDKQITVNLAPASVRKAGTGFDLPIAVSILYALNQMIKLPENVIILGELGLDGSVNYVNGLLPMVLSAKKAGYDTFIIPQDGLDEVCFVENTTFLTVKTLSDILCSTLKEQRGDAEKFKALTTNNSEITFTDISGHNAAKRALAIAIAGRHNILMNGPPGSGKTVLSKAARSLLPPLTLEEAMQTTMIYSISGLLVHRSNKLLTERPFRAPHHTTSHVALIGGGTHPRPGEISLAHNGILFLDEFPEFPHKTLEALRQPLESHSVHITRTRYSVEFPAEFMLIAAMNPCPCGFLTDTTKECTCSTSDISRYRKRISGPITDRMDIFVEVPKLSFSQLVAGTEQKTQFDYHEIINKALKMQVNRYGTVKYNSQLSVSECKKYCTYDAESKEILRKALDSWSLSGRAYYRILKVARTIADIETSCDITPQHILEALQFRNTTMLEL